MPNVNMKQLLSCRNEKLNDSSKSDVRCWYEIYNLISNNISLVDRSGIVKFPYDFKNLFLLPNNLTDFNKTYQQICIERAEQLIAQSHLISKPIVILYSGGIDSTTVVISFILASGGNYDNIFIALNTQSIRENPKFYFSYIRGKFKLVPSEQALDLLDGSSIIVGGEFNDQLFGTDIYKKIIDHYDFEYLNQLYTEKRIIDFLNIRGMSLSSSKIWYSLLHDQIKSTNLCEIKTIKDFFWWYNFCFKWQSVYCRTISRSTKPDVINQEFLDIYYQQFFITEDFQKWSMLNPDKKIIDSWSSYKISAKEFIFDFNRDQDYFDSKTKVGSLQMIFRQRNLPDALDSDFQPIWNIDKNNFYISDNSFK